MKLELSALNNLTGVAGVQDIDLPIDGIQDILNDIQDTVFSLDDLGDFLEGDGAEAFRDATPIDEIAEAIAGGGDTDISIDLQGVVDAIIDELESTQAVLIANIDNAQNQLEQTIIDETDDISVVVDGLDIDEDDLADEIADELELPVGDGTIISFDSVFGATATTIIDSFEIAIDETIGDPEVLPDGIETVTQALALILESLGEDDDESNEGLIIAIEGAVIQGIVALPGGELLDAPDSFIDSQVDRVTDGLVDQSAIDNLEQSIEEAP
jgi:hypothetical protein